MEIAEFIQKFFLLFLPGIVGMLLYNQINIREEQQGYVESLKLVCLSLASYLLTDALFLVLRLIPGFLWGPVNIVEVIAAEEIRLPTANVFASVIAAIGIAFFLTMANDEGWTASIAERLSAKRRKRIEEGEAAWRYLLERGRAVVYRDFVTQYTYYGTLTRFSERDGKIEACLQDVRVINGRTKKEYRAQVLYLSREHNQFLIEIQDPQDNRSGNQRKEGLFMETENVRKLLRRQKNRRQEESDDSFHKVEIRWLGPRNVEIVGGEKADPNFVPFPFFDDGDDYLDDPKVR